MVSLFIIDFYMVMGLPEEEGGEGGLEIPGLERGRAGLPVPTPGEYSYML